MTKHLAGTALACSLVAVSLSTTSHGPRSITLPSRDSLEPVWIQELTSRSFAPRLSFWNSHRPLNPSVPLELQGSVPVARSSNEQGALYLLDGRLKAALAILEEAVADEPSKPALLNDLAAAYLVRAGQEGGVYAIDRVEALALLDRAVAATPESPPILFNRALALEEIGLWPEAIKAWDRYLQADGSSGWAEEAFTRRVKLEKRLGAQASWEQVQELLDQVASRGNVRELRKIVGGFRQQVRIHAEEVVLSRWAAFMVEGRREEAQRELAIARTIAALLEEKGDRLLSGAVLAIDDAARTRDQRRLKILAEAHVAFRQGLDRYEPIDLIGARPKLIEARDAFKRVGSPFALWASFYLAICDYYDGQYVESLEAFASLRVLAEKQEYLSLVARARWMEGMVHLQRSMPTEAMEALHIGLDLFTRLDEREHVASIHDRLALCLGSLGETGESWKSLDRALQLRGDVMSPRRLYTIFYRAQDMALHRGEPGVALYFLDEAVAATRAWGSAAAVAEALWSRSRLLQRLGRVQEALADLREAERKAKEIRAAPLQKRILGDIIWVEAEARLSSNPKESIRDLSSALEIYREIDYSDHLIPVLLERGRANRAVGDYDSAEKDFQAAISLYEERRRKVEGMDFRISYFDQSEALFDEMVSFQVEHGKQPLRALEYAERARARALLDSVSGGNGLEPKDEAQLFSRVETLAGQIPDDLAVIEYAVLSDRVLLWTLESNRVGFRTIPLGRIEVEALVRRLRLDILKRRESAAASELYRLLVAPALEDAGQVSALVFVPDKSLHRLPFAALQDPETGRFLAQDRSITIAPSISLYLLSRARDAAMAGRVSGGALFVGNPAFSSREFPGLPPLPAAEQEALEIGGRYVDAEILVGQEATRRQFLKLASGAEIIHIASHAFVNTEAPSRSKLILAPEGGESGSGNLYASEIQALQLPETRLVVLGACNTASGYVWKQEGVANLARPFLAAGVPAVVATLWKVDDKVAALVFNEFHKNLSHGDDPVEALRKAQNVLISSSDESLRSPFSWAGFSVLGGVFSPQTGPWAASSKSAGNQTPR